MSRWPLSIFRSVGQRSSSKVKPILDKLGKGGISVSQTSIFQLYLWPHIDVQVAWRRLTYGWAPNSIGILYGSNVPIQNRCQAILSVLPRLEPSMAQWNSNSQLKGDPYAVSLDNCQILCTHGVKTFSRLFTTLVGTRRLNLQNTIFSHHKRH